MRIFVSIGKRILIERLLLLLLLSIAIISSNGAANTPYTVHTTLRGKKYTIPNVSTVKEVQQSLQDQSGENKSNIILLFGGQKLKSNDILEDIGVEDGSTMNAIVSTKKKKKSSSSSSSSSVSSPSSAINEGGSEDSNPNPNPNPNNMEELMKQSGLDPNLMQNLFSQNNGGGGNLEQSMKMMQEMINTPYFQEFLNDPDKMEESRQLLLQNPMMKSMLDSIPFMKDIIGDKEKFRQTMISAAQMYKEMGSEDGAGSSMMAEAMQRMNGLFGTNNNGMPFGLDMNGIIDKSKNDNHNLALDELSEDDDD